jgi:hypothetical protein
VQHVVLVRLPPEPREVARDRLESRDDGGDEDQQRERGEEQVDGVAKVTINDALDARLAARPRLGLILSLGQRLTPLRVHNSKL